MTCFDIVSYRKDVRGLTNYNFNSYITSGVKVHQLVNNNEICRTKLQGKSTC